MGVVPGGRRESCREVPVAFCGGDSGEPVQREVCLGQAGDLQREHERLLEKLARPGEAAVGERNPAELVESAAGLAPDADLARKCERLSRVVAGSGQVGRPRKAASTEVPERQRHPGEVAYLGTDAVALLEQLARASRVSSLGAPHAEVVQGGAEGDRIPRLLGDGQSIFQDGDPLRRCLRARPEGG